MGEASTPLSEDWLGAVGFKWHQHERQNHKHWKLLLGRATDGGRLSTPEDIYIEVTPSWWLNRDGEKIGDPTAWHCWLGGMNSSFLHVRYMRTVEELTDLIACLTGQPWDATNNLYGMMHTPERAEQLRKGGL